MKRNGSGDVYARLFRSTYQNETSISGGIAFRKSTTDNYIRFCTSGAAVRSFIGAVPTGRTLTINGSSQSLASNRTWSVGTITGVTTGNGISGGGTSGSISVSFNGAIQNNRSSFVGNSSNPYVYRAN